MRKFITSALQFFLPGNPLLAQLEHLLGYKPGYLPFYEIALTHRSKNDEALDNNERLEFLGDAILGAVVAEYLFKLYPSEDEGFLTELRSKIVRRETLNDVATRMGLKKIVVFNHNDKGLSRSHIFGNALEALVGAVYLDKGYALSRKFILQQIIKPYIDVKEMAATDKNFKNQLLTWAQKNNRVISFIDMGENKEGGRRVFTMGIELDGEKIAEGNAFTKKDAGQVAAKHALEVIPNLSGAINS